MKKVDECEYKKFIEWAGNNTANRVYPLSIAEGFQKGDIFVNDGDNVKAVLFWHYCGFAYISGNASESFLRDIYSMMTAKEEDRRLVLITDDNSVIDWFHKNTDAALNTRVEYEHSLEAPVSVPFDSERFKIERIDADTLSGISGRIVPSFSWESDERFLKNGFGYAALEGSNICAVAFSSAVSSDEVDVGVETMEAYRMNGLAATVSAAMCSEILSIGKKPVWAHAATNEGSMHTALKCGFIRTRTTTTIMCKG